MQPLQILSNPLTYQSFSVPIFQLNCTGECFARGAYAFVVFGQFCVNTGQDSCDLDQFASVSGLPVEQQNVLKLLSFLWTMIELEK